jgi:putative CRISPR-associated protein (TIGR02619 family)
MRRTIISTIGTSLLTQQIDRANTNEKDWYNLLRDSANLKQDSISPQVYKIILTLKERAMQQLKTVKIEQIRLASAELNGIYGIYNNNLNLAKEDIHFLITTDTLQGLITAQIVESFLREQGVYNITIFRPLGLSTANTENFSLGIDELLVWLEDTIPPLKQQGYLINFNLVGGFKSLQGYLNTIGMFYADEISYIFEGNNSELITIPRLPITIDIAQIKPHTLNLALLDAGAELNPLQVKDIPESMIAEIDGKITISTWGQLIWNQVKAKLLSKEILNFPRLVYQDTFKRDYNQIKESRERIKLQETLAKVSYLLEQNKGDTSVLKQDGGLQYDKYTNKSNIEHFRVNQGIRVSCHSEQGQLILYRYGKEPDINKNPF